MVGFQSFANGLFYCSANHNRSVRVTVMGGIQERKCPFVSYCSAEVTSKSINRKRTCGDKFLCYTECMFVYLSLSRSHNG